MAGEENQNLELVRVSTSQNFASINKKHVLSASILEKTDEKFVPLYKLTQQPTMMLKPSELIMSEVSSEIYAITPYTGVENNEDDANAKAISATPISSSAPEGVVPKPCLNNNENQIVAVQEGASSERSVASQISFQERKQNWIVRRLPRSKGNRFDPYYVHLKTDVQFRSLVAVHNFVVNGNLPQRRKTKKEDDEKNDVSLSAQVSHPRKLRGDKLLNRMQVGHYNLTTGEIIRDEDYNKALVVVGSKRKREEEEGVSNLAQETPQLIFTLYDFEPIN